MKKLLVLGFIVTVIALMAYYPHAMLNPGELIQSHQDINQKCLSCHTFFKGTPSEKCISCHKLSEIGIDTLTGAPKKNKVLFHEKLNDFTCTKCHTDHAGLVQAASMTKFSHQLLSGADINNCIGCHSKPTDKLHQQLTTSCSNCHTTAQWKLDGPFDHNMIQPTLKTNCTACHSKPSDALHAAVDNNCAQCHSTAKWSPATFEHAKYFLLDRDHNVKCATCHTGNNFSQYTCYGCHEHTTANILREHNEEGIINNLNQCARCHKSASEHGMEGGEGRGERDGERGGGDDD